jgi:two-component system CheB/CheR fusion protein
LRNSSKDTVKPSFPIVGIGASAGGLDALEQFFHNVPVNSGVAFVVVQHLDPTHVCILPELLQRITALKVIQVSDHQKVQPNCVYIIPPNKSMSMLNGVLHLFEPVESRGFRLPVDIFFRSLADDLQDKSIGVVLSGMGSDGSLGLKVIKEKGGLVLVQDPSTTRFDSMPRCAIDAVATDIVAPPDELPGRLMTCLKMMRHVNQTNVIDSKYLCNLEKIILLLREQTGHDFSQYKKNTLFRRIERRKGIHQIDKISTYVGFLQQNPKETELLFKELLIGVTSFFRDGNLWDKLRDVVLPELLKVHPGNHQLRAWVIGCSTGEEAYSLAIIFKEAIKKPKKRFLFLYRFSQQTLMLMLLTRPVKDFTQRI